MGFCSIAWIFLLTKFVYHGFFRLGGNSTGRRFLVVKKTFRGLYAGSVVPAVSAAELGHALWRAGQGTPSLQHARGETADLSLWGGAGSPCRSRVPCRKPGLLRSRRSSPGASGASPHIIRPAAAHTYRCRYSFGTVAGLIHGRSVRPPFFPKACPTARPGRTRLSFLLFLPALIPLADSCISKLFLNTL